MRRQLFALVFVALPLALALSAAQRLTAQTGRTTAAPSGIEIDALDRKIDPCTDFYQFACGGWIAKNPLPADRRSYGRFAEVQERNFTLLRRILESPGAEGDRKKAADFYAACMDEPAIETAGLTPIAPDLATIDEILNPDDLPVLVAHMHSYGVPVLFRFGAQTDLDDATNAIASIDQAGLGLPDRDYYLKTDQRSAELRDKYVAVIQKTFTLAREPAEQASADAKAVLSIETALATAMLTTNATATRTVDALAHDGLVERRIAKGDKRGVVICATAEGRRIHRQRSQRTAMTVSTLLSDVGDPQLEEIAEFLTGLTRIIRDQESGRPRVSAPSGAAGDEAESRRDRAERG